MHRFLTFCRILTNLAQPTLPRGLQVGTSDRRVFLAHELFDGEAPYTPGGATACAPSVGELLRCYVEDVLGISPAAIPTAEDVPFGPMPASPFDGVLPG